MHLAMRSSNMCMVTIVTRDEQINVCIDFFERAYYYQLFRCGEEISAEVDIVCRFLRYRK